MKIFIDGVEITGSTGAGVIVQGNVAHDAPDAGNPVKIGGRGQTDNPSAVANDDRVDAWFDEYGSRAVFISADGSVSSAAIDPDWGDGDSVGSGRLRTDAGLRVLGPDAATDRVRGLGDTAGAGLGVIAAAPWIPGASDVKSKTIVVGATSVNIATIIDPTSGKKVRILSVKIANKSTTSPDKAGVYFGTGAAYLTNPTTVIGEYIPTADGSDGQEWPDGGGPIGAADANVSWITETETEVGMDITIQYREE